MARYGSCSLVWILIFLFFSLTGMGQDLCTRVDMKPLLSLEQVRMNEMVDFLCDIAGLKSQPNWPKPDEIAKMNPEEYYRLETKRLVDNGFPPIFLEIEPDRLVNRRFFAQLMFQVAMETDAKVKQDCGGASTETEQLDCLVKHDWIYSQAGKIYREEILSVLCEKKDDIAKVVPPPVIKPPEISPQEFIEGILENDQYKEEVLETPATPF